MCQIVWMRKISVPLSDILRFNSESQNAFVRILRILVFLYKYTPISYTTQEIGVFFSQARWAFPTLWCCKFDLKESIIHFHALMQWEIKTDVYIDYQNSQCQYLKISLLVPASKKKTKSACEATHAYKNFVAEPVRDRHWTIKTTLFLQSGIHRSTHRTTKAQGKQKHGNSGL